MQITNLLRRLPAENAQLDRAWAIRNRVIFAAVPGSGYVLQLSVDGRSISCTASANRTLTGYTTTAIAALPEQQTEMTMIVVANGPSSAYQRGLCMGVNVDSTRNGYHWMGGTPYGQVIWGHQGTNVAAHSSASWIGGGTHVAAYSVKGNPHGAGALTSPYTSYFDGEVATGTASIGKRDMSATTWTIGALSTSGNSPWGAPIIYALAMAKYLETAELLSLINDPYQGFYRASPWRVFSPAAATQTYRLYSIRKRGDLLAQGR